MGRQHQVLAQKWRPHQFSDVVGQTHAVRALSNALNQSFLHHAYLFTGTRGVGKTTIARILAKCFNCEQGIQAQPCNQCNHCQEIDAGRFLDLIEVDAASRTKVEDTRELLDNIQYAPAKGRFKVYLIDEVHMLSGHSFNALLKTLEEPPAHVKFLLATTDPQRLPATILSRCLQFHLLAMPPEQIDQHLQAILGKEDIHFESEATALLAAAAEGSMRDALSLLDQCIAYGNGNILTADVKTMLGTIDSDILYRILQTLCEKDVNTLLENIAHLSEQAVDFSRALAHLLELLHQMAVIQAVGHAPTMNANKNLLDLAKAISREDTQLYYQIGLIGQRDLPWAPSPRSGFEMTLLRMLAFTPHTAEYSKAETSPVSVSQTVSQTVSQSAAPSPPPQSTTGITWNDLLPKLPLTGATKALAEHCGLKEFTETHLTLILPPKQQPLLNQKHIDRIREALSQYFGKNISVEILIDTQHTESPAQLAQRQQQTQQQAAEKAILSDPIVQQMIQAFDATVIKESINAKGERKH